MDLSPFSNLNRGESWEGPPMHRCDLFMMSLVALFGNVNKVYWGHQQENLTQSNQKE